MKNQGRQRFFRRPVTKASLILLSFVCGTVLLAVGCRRQTTESPDIVVTHEITPQPVRVGATYVVLGLKGGVSKPVTGARISLEADMSHPGMAPVFGEASEIAPGHYQGQINLTMAGDWVVLVHITLANGRKVERQIELKGVEGK